jgi:hypothetical protein
MVLFTAEQWTTVAHSLILAGVVAAYLKSKRVESLVDIQKQTIDTLKDGFDACKQNLRQLEERVTKMGQKK